MRELAGDIFDKETDTTQRYPTQAKGAYSMEPRLCFILGVLQRSGTNYIYRLLGEHPDCATPGPIWEDWFLHHSGLLRDYTDKVRDYWKRTWEVETKIGSQEMILRYLGDGICRFLRLQLSRENSDLGGNKFTGNEETNSKILLTKTPSVVGVKNFFSLFPESQLIIVVRDGRAVIESGVRTFNWNYEDAMRRWSAGAHAILDLKEEYSDSNRKLLIVKYEDLFLREREEVTRILLFLGVDPHKYDFSRADALGVSGSSERKAEGGTVHWRPVTKSRNFNPLDRFSNWDAKLHERFNWIAGSYMTQLGYDIQETAGNRFISSTRNRLLDVRWKVASRGFR